MIELLIFVSYIFVGWALTAYAVDAKIFLKPRTFLKDRSEFLNGLLSCYLCAGFWVGLLMVCLGFTLPASIWIFSVHPFYNIITHGLLISATSFWIKNVLTYLNPNT